MRFSLIVKGCNITTLQPYGFARTRFASGALDLSGQNLVNLQPYAFSNIGLLSPLETLNVSWSNIRYAPDFLLWASRIYTVDMSHNAMTALVLDTFLPSTLAPPQPPPQAYPSACHYDGALTTDWIMGDSSVGGLAPFAFATSLSASVNIGQIDKLDLSYSGIRQITQWSIMMADCAILAVDLTGNDFSSPVALTSPSSIPSCLQSAGITSAIASGMFQDLRLSSTNLTTLPSGVFNGLNAVPASSSDGPAPLHLWFDHNPGLYIEQGAFDGMMSPQATVSVDLTACNLTTLPPLLFANMASQAVVNVLTLNENNFGDGVTLKEALRQAPFPGGGQISLVNAGLTSLPTEAFPIAYPNQLAPFLRTIELSQNDFSLGIIAPRAFALPKENGVQMGIGVIFLNDARLRSTSLAPGCFDDVDLSYTLHMDNEIPDVGDLSPGANYFDPFPEDVLAPGTDANGTVTTQLKNLYAVYIGGVMSLPYALLGQHVPDPSVSQFTLQIHFHPEARADVAIIKALTYPNQTQPAPSQLMKIFSLTLAGYNLSLPAQDVAATDTSSSTSPGKRALNAVSLADAALLSTICSRADAGRCFLTPHFLQLALVSQFTTPTFLAHFGTLLGDWPLQERLNELVYQRPTTDSPYPVSGGGYYDQTLDRIPWEASLTSLPADLLCSLHDLTSFQINFGVYLPGYSADLRYPVLTTLPTGFFACLAQVEGGALNSIDLRYAYFQGAQQLYLAGLTSAQLTIQLDLSTLYSPTSPLPLGMFEDLDASAIVRGVSNPIITSNCANPIGTMECMACPKGQLA